MVPLKQAWLTLGLHWWTDAVALIEQATFPRLLVALVLGSLIGAERQWRQRAGMRTNTLVCFGAAAFVDLGATVGGPGTTSIIVYVISGVGFLGAGTIHCSCARFGPRISATVMMLFYGRKYNPKRRGVSCWSK